MLHGWMDGEDGVLQCGWMSGSGRSEWGGLGNVIELIARKVGGWAEPETNHFSLHWYFGSITSSTAALLLFRCCLLRPFIMAGLDDMDADFDEQLGLEDDYLGDFYADDELLDGIPDEEPDQNPVVLPETQGPDGNESDTTKATSFFGEPIASGKRSRWCRSFTESQWPRRASNFWRRRLCAEASSPAQQNPRRAVYSAD